MKISILIPAYNERYTICDIIRKVSKAQLPDGFEREMIVVDDYSIDGTFDLLKNLLKEIPEIKLFRQNKNMGKGVAIKKAIEMATGDIAIIQDADLEYDPNEYIRLLEPIVTGYADVVYGSRFASTTLKRVLFFRHALGNRFLTFLSNIFTDLNLTDMETCYKAFRMELLKSIPIRSKRFGFEPEITAKIAKREFRVYEVPISYYGRTYEEGKKITWKDGIEALYTIFKYWLIDDIYTDADSKILNALSGTRRFNSWMVSQIDFYVGNEVLEIGSGIGNLTHYFLPRDRYVCSDIDPLHLHRLSNRFYRRPNIEIKKLDISEKIEFHKVNDQYDTVICINVLEHIENHKLALMNINKLLKQGGRLILLVPNSPFLFTTLDEALGHIRRYKKNEINSLLLDTGFELEKIWYFNRISVLGWIWNGKILKRRHFSRLQLKIFDSLIWLWKRIDPYFPWHGQSIIAIAKK